MVDDDFEKFSRKLRIEQVAKAIKENPKNWSSKLEELGFQWFDDEYDLEEEEEKAAKPGNSNQDLLVAYFEELVQDFFLYTDPDSVDALYELEQRYNPDSSKGKIIQRIRVEQNHQSYAVIEF